MQECMIKGAFKMDYFTSTALPLQPLSLIDTMF